jgi:hypothetical protein
VRLGPFKAYWTLASRGTPSMARAIPSAFDFLSPRSGDASRDFRFELWVTVSAICLDYVAGTSHSGAIAFYRTPPNGARPKFLSTLMRRDNLRLFSLTF